MTINSITARPLKTAIQPLKKCVSDVVSKQPNGIGTCIQEGSGVEQLGKNTMESLKSEGKRRLAQLKQNFSITDGMTRKQIEEAISAIQHSEVSYCDQKILFNELYRQEHLISLRESGIPEILHLQTLDDVSDLNDYLLKNQCGSIKKLKDSIVEINDAVKNHTSIPEGYKFDLLDAELNPHFCEPFCSKTHFGLDLKSPLAVYRRFTKDEQQLGELDSQIIGFCKEMDDYSAQLHKENELRKLANLVAEEIRLSHEPGYTGSTSCVRRDAARIAGIKFR